LKIKFLIPLIIFVVVCGFLTIGLNLDPKKVPSPLINKPIPSFTLNQLINSEKKFTNRDLLGKVWLLNIWASWCPACRDEHPLLMEIAKNNSIPIIGLNWKDDKKAAINVLKKTGNPYQLSIFDPNNKVGIDFGVYGAPESFIIDKKGIIRYKHIGPLNSKTWYNQLLPIIKQYQQIN